MIFPLEALTLYQGVTVSDEFLYLPKPGQYKRVISEKQNKGGSG